MERKEKRNISKGLLTGTLVAGAFLSVSSLSAATTSNLFDYNTLGSGSELRSEILLTDFQSTAPIKNIEMACGEKKAETKKTDAKTESKAEDAKCGEGKCGEKKAETKKADAKAESKTKDAKCGEGKCGEKKK